MSRREFLRRLEELLYDISENERREAIQYYKDYLDDAGVENEEEVLEALGTPEQVAAVIKDSLREGNGEEGEYTETGYKSGMEPKSEEIARRAAARYRSNQAKAKSSGLSTGMIVLIVLLALCAAPIIIPIAIALLAVFLALGVALCAVVVALIITGVVMVGAGIVFVVKGIGEVFVAPYAGIVTLGISLFVIGLGLLCILLMVWIFTKAIPGLVRGFVALCRLPLKKREARQAAKEQQSAQAEQEKKETL